MVLNKNDLVPGGLITALFGFYAIPFSLPQSLSNIMHIPHEFGRSEFVSFGLGIRIFVERGSSGHSEAGAINLMEEWIR